MTRETGSYRGLAALLSLAVFSLCVSGCHTSRPALPEKNPAVFRYPANWWAPIPNAGAPGWEILPQEAGPGEVIVSKRNELGLLSNFAATPFTYHGKRYASIEGFWQMMKFPEGPDDPRAKYPGLKWEHTRDEVAAMTAFEAKRAGTVGEKNMKAMGINWVTFEGKQMEYKPAIPGEHYRIIVEAMWAKVWQNKNVHEVLLATGNLVLRPDHHHEPDAAAAWHYCEIWMEIRAKLQAGAAGPDGPTHPTQVR